MDMWNVIFKTVGALQVCFKIKMIFILVDRPFRLTQRSSSGDDVIKIKIVC